MTLVCKQKKAWNTAQIFQTRVQTNESYSDKVIMYQGPKSNKDGKHTCTVVCALVCDLAAVKPKELGMCRFRPWLLCMVILWEEVQESRSQDYSICPITTPCHCEPDDVINCSSRRLKKLPFFLEFYFVWADLNLSDNLLHQLPSDSLHSVKVRNLNLSKNILTLVHPQSFTGTQGVELLNLAHNYLSYLPPDMFLHLPEIKTLNLAYNRYVQVIHSHQRLPWGFLFCIQFLLWGIWS